VRFYDRAEAGEKLSQALGKYKDDSSVILALPRGGVPVAVPIARKLKASLDLVIPRKIGHPEHSEYAICAVCGDELVANEEEKMRVDPDWFEKEVERQREEAQRRREVYLKGKERVKLAGKTVILVDDGAATGLTMRAAIKAVRKSKPKRIVIALPVVPEDAAQIMESEADEVVALMRDKHFTGSVGSYYDNFAQVTDKEVTELLKQV
jgi:putative phosphoribosyl transferase